VKSRWRARCRRGWTWSGRADAEDAADCVFQGPGDFDLHLGDIPIRHAGHDGDARESHLGIDAAGHARGAVDAPGGQQGAGQVSPSRYRGGLCRQVHHAMQLSKELKKFSGWPTASGRAYRCPLASRRAATAGRPLRIACVAWPALETPVSITYGFSSDARLRVYGFSSAFARRPLLPQTSPHRPSEGSGLSRRRSGLFQVAMPFLLGTSSSLTIST
jgi:hypothetical protein